jgi:hypothetical protein
VRAHVELRASEADVAFYFVERDGSVPAFCAEERWRPECVHGLSVIRPLCVAPCSIDLAPSERRLAVSHRGGDLVLLDAPLALAHDGTLEVSYASRRPARLAGRILLGTLLPIAAGCFVATAWTTSSRARRGFGLGGLAAAGLGFGLGLSFAFRGDDARVRFVPSVP